MLSNLWNDIRYASRNLIRSPGFSAAAILTIALGIGVNAGIFSVLNGVAFRDLSVPEPQQLLTIHQEISGVENRFSSGASSFFSTSEFETYRDRSETLSGIAGFTLPWSAVMDANTLASVNGVVVTCTYFDVLRQRPVAGPGLLPEHCDNPGVGAVVVISHDLWVDRFDSDPSIGEKSIGLNGHQFAVVGVAPEGFHGADVFRSDFFVPVTAQRLLRPDRDYLDNDNLGWLTLVGRRDAAVNLAEVRAELGVIASQIDQQQPGRTTRLTINRATPFSMPELRGLVLGASAVIMAAFALVLIIACTNVANLLLARGDARVRDIAIRLSLGATRGRLVRQLLAESLVISVAGGVLGTVLALWSFQTLVVVALSALPADLQMFRVEIVPDYRVMSFALALAIGTTIVFGLAPAMQLSKPDLRTAIDHGVLTQGLSRRGRLQGILVGVQVAVCMVLVISTTLLLRGLYAAQTVDPGFAYEDLVVASTDLRGFGYEGARAAAFQSQLVEQVSALPGVEAVAQSFLTPLEMRNRTTEVRLPGQEQPFPVGVNMVSANYFSVIGIPIVRGRTFTDAEIRSATTTAVIVTESTALKLWPNQEPLGQTLLVRSLGPGMTLNDTSAEIVGVAKDVNVLSLAETDTSYMYTPSIETTMAEMQLLIRSPLDPASIAGSIRAVVAELDSTLVVGVSPLEQNLEIWRRLSRLVASLSSSLGVLALVLACVGIYGVISFFVSRRIREVGIRLALGASKRDVFELVLRKAMGPVIVGALVGLAMCVGVSQLLSGLLFGISSLDPVALVAGTFVVLALALAAALVPARRATRVDPMTTLRYQ